MAELLIKAISATNSNPERDRIGCYKRGMPVQVLPDGSYAIEAANINSKMLPPTFFWLLIPALDQQQTEELREQANKVWERHIEYTVLTSNHTSGIYQIRASNVNVSTSGEGGLTQRQIQAYLTNWGATLDSSAANSVTFSINLWTLLRSSGFWQRDVSNIVFTLNSYASGTANVTANYSALPQFASIAPEVSELVTERGGVVQSNANGIVTFTIRRTVLTDAFQASVKRQTDGPHMRRQFYFSSGQMDTLESNGGVMTITPAQLVAAIHNRLND